MIDSNFVHILQDGDTSAPAVFVPTVTAISTSPELKSTVKPTSITSGSCAKKKTNGARQPSSPTGAKRAKTCNKKAQKEQVSTYSAKISPTVQEKKICANSANK